MTSSEGGQALEKSTQNERTVGSSVTSVCLPIEQPLRFLP